MKQSDLLKMLTYRRPARSKTEREFIARYVDTIPGIFEDQFGNRILHRPESKVMIACHTDTVHRSAGKQRLTMCNGVVGLHASSVASNCLGADDTAGIYAAIRMIEAGVQATFIFHREEEIGGRGSLWLASNYPEWIAKHELCLSLDRRGTTDIITSQFGETCASNHFAASLGDAIGLGHSAAAGVFTDSANYAHLIPECSNLSIGYRHEHTPRETLDLDYLDRVVNRLISVDWNALTIARDLDAEPDWLLDVEYESEEYSYRAGLL